MYSLPNQRLTCRIICLGLTVIVFIIALTALRASPMFGSSQARALVGDTADHPGFTEEPTGLQEDAAALGPSSPQAVPQPPTAVDDLYATPLDTVLNVPAWQGVLENDIAAAGGVLTATIEDPPAAGTLTLTVDGGFVYQPPPGYEGLMAFTYDAHETSIVGSGVFTDNGQSFFDQTGYAVALGDVDGDGDDDAVVGICIECLVPGVWLNDGTGGFSASPHFAGSWGADDIALGDLDDDGDLDAVYAVGTYSNTVYFNQGGLQGGTPGAFSYSAQDMGVDGSGVALGDLDGDGDIDIVFANNGANTVYTNTQQSGIFSDTGREYGAAQSVDVALGDVDGDDDLDAVFANLEGPNEVYINEGDGIFSLSGQTLGNTSSWGVALGDVDGDGDLDAVFADSSGSTVWRNDGNGAFTDTGQNFASGRDVALGDLNDDGAPDIFVASAYLPDVWFNDGNGVFSDSGQVLRELTSYGIDLADLDGDGDLDAFSADSSRLATAWLNQNTTRTLSDTAIARILVGDVDRPVDIVLSNDTVAENQPAGTLVGTLSTIDPSSDTHIYALVPGPGSDHNASFAIVGQQLRTSVEFDYEGEPSTVRSIRVETDNGELTLEKTLLIHIADVEPEPDGPPTQCSGDDITLFDTQDARATLTNISVSNADPFTGCDIEGDLNIRLPGNNLTSIPFQAHVDKWNKLLDSSVAPFDLQISGLPLHADKVRLASYAGKMSVRLGTAEICAPAEWGGQCASATHANLRVDGSGLFVGSGGELPIPEMTIHQTANTVQRVAGPSAPAVNSLVELDFFSAELTAVREDPQDKHSPVIGYEIKASAELGLPKIAGKKESSKNACHIAVHVTFYQSASGMLMMTIETAPDGINAPQGLEFREGHLGLVCDKGIPIDATGLQVSGVFGTISLRPDAQWVEIGLEITSIDSSLSPADFELLKIEAIVKILWQPEWGVDLKGSLTLLEFFKAAEAEAKIRSDRLSFTMTIQTFFMRGELQFYAWWPDGSFHFSGSGKVTVGLWKGFIWDWCAPWPFDWFCIIIPPFDITLPPVGADFGEFTNGRYGVKGYIEVFGKQYGFYVDEDGDFDIGGVSEYTIVTPPEFARALQRWRAAQQQAERDGLWLDPEGWDDVFSFPDENTAEINVTISPSDVITRMQVNTPTDVSFLVSSQVPVTVSLRTPGSLIISPDNYNQPPISPTHNVFFTVTDQITYTQYWYDVRPAEIGEWQVIVEGDLDAAKPAVAVVGFANIPTLGDVIVADTSDPSQVPVNWSLNSDVSAVVTVYANRGSITSTVTVTDSGGLTRTEVISNFSGVPVGAFPVNTLDQLQGAMASATVDLTTLESDDYALWLALEDAINPAINVYARTPGTNAVARVTVDNAATFPTSWSPVVTATVIRAAQQLRVEWEALDHPDVDDYTIYIGQAPNTPDIAITGLSAVVKRDSAGRPLGSATVWYDISDVKPGETYYVSLQANDHESAQSVRTAEVSRTIRAGRFRLRAAGTRYGVPRGGSVTIPLSLEITAPLFYPQVNLTIDDGDLPRGIAVVFEGDAIGETSLSGEHETVNAIVSVGEYVPDGTYSLRFVGNSGEMQRFVDVGIDVPAVRLYLPVVLKRLE